MLKIHMTQSAEAENGNYAIEFELDTNLATRIVVDAALKKIRRHYTKERYHNPEHTGMVHTEALALADLLPGELALKEHERAILAMAATAHDVVYAHNPRTPDYNGENEQESADWLGETMRRTGAFSIADIQLAQHAVLATRARPYPARTPEGWDPQTTIQQNVGEGGVAPSTLIAQLLCDADLSGMGSPWETYLDTMTGYYLELNPTGGTEDTWRSYLQFQNILLSNRQYYTEVARNRYGQHLLENVGRVTHLLGHAEELKASFDAMKKRAAIVPQNPTTL